MAASASTSQTRCAARHQSAAACQAAWRKQAMAAAENNGSMDRVIA
jgi:hypothetical protein